MSKDRIDILNAIPLVEVMRGWGHVARRDGESSASYLCPWHDDSNPSLVVDKQVRSGADDLGFRCFGCGQEGYGAVQLAARLMGLPAGQLAAGDLGRVMDELQARCAVEVPEEDGRRHYDTLRTSIVGWDEFRSSEPQYADMADGEARFEPGAWTEEGLRALGLSLELAARKARRKDAAEGNEVRVGDMLTEFDPDTGEALYRCSIGKDFYRVPQKAETRTVARWGEEVGRLFGVEPVARFMKRITPEQGGSAVRVVRATRNYPIFMFRYPWGVKKYEPKDVYGNKWTWFNVSEDADLYHRWYADAQLTDALRIRAGEMRIEDSCLDEVDERHPYELEKDKDGKPLAGKPRFERVVLCSGPRDAIAVWSHSSAHVVWLHSEQAGFDKKGGNVRPNRWLRAFIRKLLAVTADGGLYVCYDEDATGLAASQAIALNNPQVRWLRLPRELSQVQSGQKPLKDVTDFVTRFAEVEGRMPADVQHDDPTEWFGNAMYDTPTCQFWQWESERKDADGTGRARYKFDLRNTPVFLRARGMVRKVVQQGKDSYSRYFLLGNDHMYTECFPGEKGSANRLLSQARELMAEWLRAHKEFNDEKGALSRAIYSAKLEQSAMDSVEQVDFDEKSFGADFDHFFFRNTAVMVTADEIRAVPYTQMRWWTNSEAVLDGTFTVLPQYWHVVENPLYAKELAGHEAALAGAKTPEERAQENMRWSQWSSLWRYLLKLDRPLEEMPLHFRFLYNTARISWEKEASGGALTAEERQLQDMYMIQRLHAYGSAVVRHRSADRQQSIYITDNGTRREDLASGGTGKTIMLELLEMVRRVLKIDGKLIDGGNIKLSQETDKVVPGLHNIIAVDELPQGFRPNTIYNYGLSLTSRGLYRSSVKLEGDDLPKWVIASNEVWDLSSDSTARRTYEVETSDWYHPRSMDGSRPAHTPADDFRGEGVKEVARNLPPALLNEARNLLIGCAQLFLQHPDETIRPPKDYRALLRQALAASMDEEFTRWISWYLSDPRHIGIPISQRELGISLLDYCGVTIGTKTLKAVFARINNNLPDFIRSSVYVVDPEVVWTRILSDREKGYCSCPAWMHELNEDGTVKTDADGNRLPRVLVKKASHVKRVYYFYRKGHVPRNFYDKSGEHDGDPDYVQPAPEKDPEGG